MCSLAGGKELGNTDGYSGQCSFVFSRTSFDFNLHANNDDIKVMSIH